MISNRPPRHTLDWFRSAGHRRPSSGWRRVLDLALRKLGPSWEAAPVRRALQTVCLLVYLDLFFRVSWPYPTLFSGQGQPPQEWLPVEIFLWIDPLVGLSTAIAARWWNVAVIGAAAILAVGLVFPRGFCGYVCPLGTLIDLFDFVVGQRIPWLKTRSIGRWTNARFHLLAAVLAAGLCGALLSGFVAAIPVLTRGLLFSAGSLQLGWARNWGMVPPLTGAVWLSLALFAAVFFLSLFAPRFWCRHVCPSGALLSLPSLLRRFERHVSHRCIACGKCAKVCSFDAIHPDVRTHALNCAFCQTCGGVCPVDAIHFLPRAGHPAGGKPDAPAGRPLNRRAMVASMAAGAAFAFTTRFSSTARTRPIRPPASAPEDRFLDLCIRCEQCMKVCPGPVLQAAGLDQGLEAMWTPVAVFSHAGCHPACNFCAQACPTGAIRPFALADKRRFAMGLAAVDTGACLPHRGQRDCRLCFDECTAAGYNAIEMRPIELATGPVPEGAFSPDEVEQMGRILAPFVKSDACVGCGLCEYRCHSAWVGQQKILPRSAVVVRAL